MVGRTSAQELSGDRVLLRVEPDALRPEIRFDVVTKTKVPSFEQHITQRSENTERRMALLISKAQKIIEHELYYPSETGFYCNDYPYKKPRKAWHIQRPPAASQAAQCGDRLHEPIAPQRRIIDPEERVYTPHRIPSKPVPITWQEKAVASGQFAKDNPALTAVAASGAGTAGLLLGPIIIAAGKMGMIAGGVAIVAGALLDSDSDLQDNTLIKAGAKLVGGSVVVTGGGYLITAAGGVSLATGAGIGAVQAGKGVQRMIQTRRETKQLKTIEASNCLQQAEGKS